MATLIIVVVVAVVAGALVMPLPARAQSGPVAVLVVPWTGGMSAGEAAIQDLLEGAGFTLLDDLAH